MHIHRSISKRICVIIAAVMLMMTGLGSLAPSYAALSAKPPAVQTDSFISSNNYTGEYYKIRTPLKEARTIYVEGKTQVETKRFCIRLKQQGASTYALTVFVAPDENGEFSIKINTAKNNTAIPAVIDGKGTVTTADETFGNCPGYIKVPNMPAGTYHLTIARATTDKEADVSRGTAWYSGPLGGSQGYAYKEAVLTVKKGQNNNPKVVHYPALTTHNNSTINLYEKKSYHDPSFSNSYVRYMDPYMNDMAFYFKDPKTGVKTAMNDERLAYLQEVAAKVTEGAQTDYEKLYKIYEYAASNFYYDVYAHKQGKYQYSNPYLNIYNFENGVSSANSKNGKVATTCQGYAAIIIALARAEGIPARYAYGHHISQPLTVWDDTTLAKMKTRDHWWTEAWVADENRWIIIDANSAANGKWNRSSFSAAGTWTKDENISYVHFDPSPAQLSTSYAYTGIYAGSTGGEFINRTDEITQLRAFLNNKSGKTNGQKLNSAYDPDDFTTWGTTAPDDFLTNGYGRVTHILWGNKNLTGKMNLSNFTQLKYLTVYNNKITQLDLTKCSSLQKISATYTKITKFDSSASKNTTSITAKGNKLTSAKFKHGSKLITISRNNVGGTFAFDYNKSKSKKLTIYASDAKKGYKYMGIYNGDGKKLTSKKTYSCNPTAAKYVVKYKKK